MRWKSWPYWVKGVAVTLGIFAILLTVAFFGREKDGISLSPLIDSVLFYLPENIGDYVTDLFCKPKGNGEWKSLICIPFHLHVVSWLFFLQGLVIGGVLGHFYGKIKNHKSHS